MKATIAIDIPDEIAASPEQVASMLRVLVTREIAPRFRHLVDQDKAEQSYPDGLNLWPIATVEVPSA